MSSMKIAGLTVLAGALGGAAIMFGAGSAQADHGHDIPWVPGPPGHIRHAFDGRHGDDVNIVVPDIPDVNVVVPGPPSVNVWLP
jgi:hypothetical protein